MKLSDIIEQAVVHCEIVGWRNNALIGPKGERCILRSIDYVVGHSSYDTSTLFNAFREETDSYDIAGFNDAQTSFAPVKEMALKAAEKLRARGL